MYKTSIHFTTDLIKSLSNYECIAVLQISFSPPPLEQLARFGFDKYFHLDQMVCYFHVIYVWSFCTDLQVLLQISKELKVTWWFWQSEPSLLSHIFCCSLLDVLIHGFPGGQNMKSDLYLNALVVHLDTLYEVTKKILNQSTTNRTNRNSQ